MTRLALTALATLAVLASAPAAAQETDTVGPIADGDYKVNQVIIYGDEECPQTTPDIITICVNGGDAYRIPEGLRTSSDPDNISAAARFEKYRVVGDFGILSCSASGAGGFTGCTQQLIDDAYAEKKFGENVTIAQLIAETRAARLSTIDEDAAEQQRRVEELERAYLERLEAERDAPLPGDGPAAGNDLSAPPAGIGQDIDPDSVGEEVID